MKTIEESLSELTTKIVQSMREGERWEYIHDPSAGHGPWVDYLKDRKTGMRLGCLINDFDKPGHYYITVQSAKYAENIDLSLEQRRAIWDVAFPIFKEKHNQFVARKLEIINADFGK